MELADAVIITKTDGDNLQKAKNASLEYKRALHLFQAMDNNWIPEVNTCSALKNTGINEISEMIKRFDQQMINSRWKIQNRERQKKYFLHQRIKEELGIKKYKLLVSKGNLNLLEKELEDGKTIYQILNTL